MATCINFRYERERERGSCYLFGDKAARDMSSQGQSCIFSVFFLTKYFKDSGASGNKDDDAA